MPGVKYAIVAAAMLSLSATQTVFAQSSLLNQIVRTNLLACRIAGGRVTIGGVQMGNVESSVKGDRRRESLNLRNENGRVQLTFKRTTKTEDLSIDYDSAGHRLVIVRKPLNVSTDPAIEFRQDPDGNVAFVFGVPPDQQEFRASDVWQLLVACPKECRKRLISVLELLRPHWKLAETVDLMEERLLGYAAENPASDRVRWTALVSQLGDDRFAKREAADRALRAGGPTAVAFLRRVDFKRLDAEQQFRVGRILNAMTDHDNDDTVEQVVELLAAEPDVWLGLLARPNPTVRQTAARHLESLLGVPIPVDPSAEPATQAAQREKLRRQIEASRGTPPAV